MLVIVAPKLRAVGGENVQLLVYVLCTTAVLMY